MRIVLTGGTGTLGRSLTRRLLTDPATWTAVRSFSRDEQKAAAMDAEFAGAGPFKAMLGDVRDPLALRMAFRGADVVVHAAALKRVDVGAYSPDEIVKTNILGTMNVVHAAIEAGVDRVLVISSDKACAPVNLYGGSKYMAETLAVQANAYAGGHTRIAAARYGNILGSRGSVIGIWRDQLARRLPLTLTSREMTRFIMTIEDATTLVLFALSEMTGGEVYIPKLKAATMETLALAVVLERGLDAAALTGMEIIGLRPGGEKLAESLLNEEEPTRTVHASPQYLAVLPTHHEWRTQGWDGPRLPADYRYRSDRVEQYTVGDLRDVIAGTEACR